jgi:hypothetical protein
MLARVRENGDGVSDELDPFHPAAANFSKKTYTTSLHGHVRHKCGFI